MKTPVLALTFDDGPSSDIMPAILELFQEYNAQATFFIWGEKITPDTAPILRQAVAQGCELANHSMHHLHMSQLSEQEIRNEVFPLQEILTEYTGAAPVFFRPPYLDVNETMQKIIPLPMIHGSSNRDWTPQTDLASRIRMAKEFACDGAILLMHCFEGNQDTLEALKTLLPWFAQQGFRVTTVSNLFAEKGITPKPGNIYNNV